MTLKTLAIATVMAVAPTFVFAMGCSGYDHTTTAASCAEGMVWDAATSKCVDSNMS